MAVGGCVALLITPAFALSYFSAYPVPGCPSPSVTAEAPAIWVVRSVAGAASVAEDGVNVG